jgi:hypothetical protein
MLGMVLFNYPVLALFNVIRHAVRRSRSLCVHLHRVVALIGLMAWVSGVGS